jgi:hypothetical protein
LRVFDLAFTGKVLLQIGCLHVFSPIVILVVVVCPVLWDIVYLRHAIYRSPSFSAPVVIDAPLIYYGGFFVKSARHIAEIGDPIVLKRIKTVSAGIILGGNILDLLGVTNQSEGMHATASYFVYSG